MLQQIPIAGINEPEIGQQIDEAEIRMKDGEVSILGGLSDRESNQSLSGVPGLTNIPLLGYLFGTKVKENIDNQILIAIIPHIMRAPDFGDLANTGVYAGTERVPKVGRSTTPVQVSLPTPSGPAAGIPRPAGTGGVQPDGRPPFPASTATTGPTLPAPASATVPFPATPVPVQVAAPVPIQTAAPTTAAPATNNGQPASPNQ